VVVFGRARIELQRVIECIDAVVAVAVVAVAVAIAPTNPGYATQRGCNVTLLEPSSFDTPFVLLLPKQNLFGGSRYIRNEYCKKCNGITNTALFRAEKTPWIQNCGFRNSDFGSQPHCIALHCIAFQKPHHTSISSAVPRSRWEVSVSSRAGM